MKPSTLKQNYRLAKILGLSVRQVMLACLSSASAWRLISKIELAIKNNNQLEVKNIRNSIAYGSFC